MDFDSADLAQRLDAVYRTRDVVRRRRLVREAVAAAPGERILDVGCGPGYYVAELAEEVGPDGTVTGIDQSPAMLAVARDRCKSLPGTSFGEGEATALPFDDASFDAVLSVQVMEYVPDVAAALAEVHRVLRPGGRVVLWDIDWTTVSWHSRDPVRMRRVLEAWDGHLIDPALPRRLAPLMRAGGFEDVRMEAHTFATAELTLDAYGGSLIGVVEPFVAASGLADEASAWAAEQRELGESGEFYFAVVQVCFTGRRA
ncbi:MAG TPA: methyltransferase domain-containing protein [Thermoleophilaceae bacterium]|jgi:SAM-dependent methyltransferase